MAKEGTNRKKKAKSAPGIQVPEREKKITVKFFLNKALQPRSVNNKKAYPLYMLITYNRKNTMLKSWYGGYCRDLAEASGSGVTAFEEKIVKKAVAYERGIVGKTFTLKGLHKKYNDYVLSVHLLLEQYLKLNLFRLVTRTKPFELAQALEFSDPKVSFDTLYTIAQKIYPDFRLPENFREEVEVFQEYNKLYNDPFFAYSFPTVIEWLDQSAQLEYRKKLVGVYKNDKKAIDRKIKLVDKIVQSRLT